MNKKFRIKLSKVMATFKTCRPKNPTSASAAPVFLHHEFPPPPPPPRPSPTRRIAAVVASSSGCRPWGPTRKRWSAEEDVGADDMPRARETPGYLWRKEEKWHVVEEFERRRKIDDDEEEEEDDDDLFTSSVGKIGARRRKREIEIHRRRRGRKSRSKSNRNSTSSIASGSWFSSGDDEENDEREDDDGDDTDTLLSSRSFTTDSTSAINRPRMTDSTSAINRPRMSSRSATAMLSRLMPCGPDQRKVVKESFAVVKQSENPRGDFRRSMVEMVVEKGIYDAADLEQLLHCFLSLNSQQHHQAIVCAFADIWGALFPESSPHISYIK